MRRKFAETRASVSISGTPSPENVTFSTPPRNAPIALYERAAALISSNRIEVALAPPDM